MKNCLIELSNNSSSKKFSEEFIFKNISKLPKQLAFPLKVEFENINLGIFKQNEKVVFSNKICISQQLNTKVILTHSSNIKSVKTSNIVKNNNFLSVQNNVKNFNNKEQISSRTITSEFPAVNDNTNNNLKNNFMNNFIKKNFKKG